LSTTRAHSTSRTSKLRLAVSGPALALLAMTGGIASTGIVSAAQASTTGHLSPVRVQSGTSRSIALDASSSPQSVQPSVSGGAGGGGKARRSATPKQIAWKMLRHFHWSAARQYPSLNRLWARESGWNVHALNPSSGAAGIPQAVPGSKMASAGPNWRTNARTQIRWGLRYIRDRYGSPRRAWRHETAVGWY
jgi:hypothetical protein